MKGQQLVGRKGPLAAALVERVSLAELAPGDVLIREGAADNDLYFVLVGRLAVLVGGREVGTRDAGQHVGEVALLDPTAPRSATVVAREPSVVAKISERDFAAVATTAPGVWRSLATGLGAILSERNRRVADPSAPRRPQPPNGLARMGNGAVTAFLHELCAEAYDRSDWDTVLQPGAVIGRFELVREIGRGGFGVVWEAHDLELHREVAFKALRRRDCSDVRIERLLHEAEAAARLSHPNIVTLYDLGHGEPGPYLVLELLRGETLADRLTRGPVQLAEALPIAAKIAAGLAHAHDHGVVHRDLKPGNVFLCRTGELKVLDLGLAFAFGSRKLLGGGTPRYMAPEQRRGAPEDERTDVFALGVVLHQMLTGKLPFGEAGAATRKPPPLHAPAAPGLSALVQRMLECDPTARPRDAGEVLVELGAIAKRARIALATPFGDRSPGPRAHV
jgi:CRP-like cAMP-binding protein